VRETSAAHDVFLAACASAASSAQALREGRSDRWEAAEDGLLWAAMGDRSGANLCVLYDAVAYPGR
jgi:hypothetical protein